MRAYSLHIWIYIYIILIYSLLPSTKALLLSATTASVCVSSLGRIRTTLRNGYVYAYMYISGRKWKLGLCSGLKGLGVELKGFSGKFGDPVGLFGTV